MMLRVVVKLSGSVGLSDVVDTDTGGVGGVGGGAMAACWCWCCSCGWEEVGDEARADHLDARAFNAACCVQAAGRCGSRVVQAGGMSVLLSMRGWTAGTETSSVCLALPGKERCEPAAGLGHGLELARCDACACACRRERVKRTSRFMHANGQPLASIASLNDEGSPAFLFPFLLSAREGGQNPQHTHTLMQSRHIFSTQHKQAAPWRLLKTPGAGCCACPRQWWHLNPLLPRPLSPPRLLPCIWARS